jgi:hypothetical protein
LASLVLATAEWSVLLLLLLYYAVCQGVVTGVVEGTPDSSAPAANIMNSALYKLALGELTCPEGGGQPMHACSAVA